MRPAGRAHEAQRLALRWLHLHHVRALVGELLRRGGAVEVHSEVDDADALQRALPHPAAAAASRR